MLMVAYRVPTACNREALARRALGEWRPLAARLQRGIEGISDGAGGVGTEFAVDPLGDADGVHGEVLQADGLLGWRPDWLDRHLLVGPLTDPGQEPTLALGAGHGMVTDWPFARFPGLERSLFDQRLIGFSPLAKGRHRQKMLGEVHAGVATNGPPG